MDTCAEASVRADKIWCENITRWDPNPPAIARAFTKPGVNVTRLAVASAVIFVFAASAAAQQPRRNPERENRIEQQLASIAPDAVVAFQNATRAMDAGDHATAVRLFREAMVHAPEFTPILRRLGGSLVAMGHHEEGRR